MENPLDLAPTLQVIDELALQLEEAAKRVRQERARMELDGDLSRAGVILGQVLDLPSRVRLDFLVTRPLQAALAARRDDRPAGDPVPRPRGPGCK